MTEVCNKKVRALGEQVCFFDNDRARQRYRRRTECGKPAIGACDIGISHQLTRLTWCATHIPPFAKEEYETPRMESQ